MNRIYSLYDLDQLHQNHEITFDDGGEKYVEVSIDSKPSGYTHYEDWQSFLEWHSND